MKDQTQDFKAIDEWEVLTSSDWQDFKGVSKVKKDRFVRVSLENGKTLEVSGGHQVFVRSEADEEAFCFADLLLPGMKVETDDGFVSVLHVEPVDEEIDLYDLVNVSNGFEYYGDGVRFHNCAWIEDFDSIWIGLQPTLSSTGGDVILISSPSGIGTRYHKIWVGAEDGSNDFHAIRLPWDVHPERDQKWFEDQCKAIGSQRGINSELLCLFEGSGNGFVDQEEIGWLETCSKPPIAKYGPDNGVWIWKYHEGGHKYMLVGDVARGDGEDSSAFHVIDTTADQVVCEYKGQLPADDFGKLIDDVGRKYDALVIVEQQGGGIATNLELKRLRYPKLYYAQFAKETLSNSRQLLDHEVADLTPGLVMSAKIRPDALVKLEQTIRKHALRIHSTRFTDELKTFVWKSGKAQAMKGYHDDLVMSLAMGLLFYDPMGGIDVEQGGIDESALAMILGSKVEKRTTENVDQQAWGTPNEPDMPGFMGGPGSRKMNTSVPNMFGRYFKRNPWGWMDD